MVDDDTLPDLYRGPKGRFLPGNPYAATAGRAKGVRDRLSQAFLRDMLADWDEHGRDVIARVRAEKPERYLQLVAQIVPREVKAEVSELEAMSDEELRAALAATLTELAETGGALIASLPPRTRELLDLDPTGKRFG
jgi:hypothetical protein